MRRQRAFLLLCTNPRQHHTAFTPRLEALARGILQHTHRSLTIARGGIMRRARSRIILQLANPIHLARWDVPSESTAVTCNIPQLHC